VVQVRLTQPVKNPRSVRIGTITGIMIRMHFFSQQVPILRSIVRRATVPAAAVKLRGTSLTPVPGTVVKHRNVKAGLAVGVHIVCTFQCHLSAPLNLSPGRIPYLGFVGKTFLYVTRLGIINGQPVFHEKGIYQRLRYTQSAVASRTPGLSMFVIFPGIAVRSRKEDLAVTVLWSPEHHVLIRKKRINAAVCILIIQ